MIENIRTHPYTRAVCLETARLFERELPRTCWRRSVGLMKASRTVLGNFRPRPGLRRSARTGGIFGQEMPLPNTSREHIRQHDRGI